MLRSAGLVSAERAGQTVVYSLDTTVFQDVVRALLDMAPSLSPGRALEPAPRKK